jgi:ABC-type lipoprotein export system ATPase subunit
MDVLKALNRDHHMTILMVTHNMETVRYGTRTLSIEDGVVSRDERHDT